MRLSTLRPQVKGAFVAAAAGILLLTGCGSDSDTSGPKKADKNNSTHAKKSGGSEGTIRIGDRTFTFSVQTCARHAEEVVLYGAGKDENAESVWVDLDAMSSTQGGLSIDLGADSMVNDSDRSIRSTDDFNLQMDGNSITATAKFTDENDVQNVPGELQVTCN